jgi:hypothetical protein
VEIDKVKGIERFLRDSQIFKTANARRVRGQISVTFSWPLESNRQTTHNDYENI